MDVQEILPASRVIGLTCGPCFVDMGREISVILAPTLRSKIIDSGSDGLLPVELTVFVCLPHSRSSVLVIALLAKLDRRCVNVLFKFLRIRSSSIDIWRSVLCIVWLYAGVDVCSGSQIWMADLG